MANTFARGAKPSPRHKLLGAAPHLVLFAPPPPRSRVLSLNVGGRQVSGVMNDDGTVNPCTWNRV